MTPEHFRQIEELYDAARERSPEERAALLAHVDPAVRREVESLLAQPTGGMLLDQPAIQAAAQLLQDSTVTELAAGACLGPYRIESKLGEGGMGEVFRAVDTRLGRAVAIKIAREQFSARFEREGRAISSLNHPNICTLYDVGPNYLVMELVEGETIAACLKKGPLSREMALRYGAQIAAALAEAHGKGIVHRDLKPGNIMLTKSGVKVLDFGLAKSERDDTLTVSRMVLGTPAYMAPEQREGKPADARSDIYSYGCVLYEMLTGRRVSPQRQPLASRALERIVGRCLEQDPARRWQSAAELERELAAATDIAPRWKAIAAAAAAVLALFAAGYFYLHGKPKLTDKDTIVLADFINKTSDPVFDGTLRQGLAVQLEQSPFLSLISDERIQQTLGLMGRPAEAPLTSKVAQEICQRTASAAVLEGSISRLGSPYVLWLRAKNCVTGEVLDEEQVEAAGKEDVLKALSQIASKFRTRVGESLATVKKHSTPLEEATTSSLEALKAYSEGWKVLASTGPPAALPHFKRATEIDPQFAMAYANLGVMYSASGQSDLSVENIGKAYQLRDRVSDAEKFFISASYDMQVTGNMEKEQQTCEAWAQTYPRNANPHGFLGGGIYPVLGKYQKALEQSKRAVDLNPDFAIHYNILAFSYVELDRLGEATNTLQRAAERKLEAPDLFAGGYEIAFLKGDQPGMERAVALSQGKFGAEDWITDLEAFVLAYSGQLQKATRKSQRAADLAQQSGQRERAALYQTGAALWEAFFGNAPEARQSAAAALELAKSREVEYGAAFALALAGDFSQPQTLASGLEKRFPEDTCVRFTYLPALRALLALKHGEPLKAIEQLQIAAPYELGAPQSSFFGSYGAMYPVYVRGEAYLAANHYAEAAAEFQKILGHRGVVLVDPIGALARWRLGKALALSGDTARAKTAYLDFLTLWKNADQDIPIFKQAKAEYARLQ
jgi:tetratricopeptide (TPR) repeat protein/predicted Ser/Thr protein kinase